jgi:hypothetical protein
MPLIAKTATRVTSNTSPAINRRIRQEMLSRVADLATQGPDAIDRRLEALDREWDVERCLETGAASLTLIGTALGATVNRKWFALPAGVAAFLLQHAVQGWCPPLPVFRRMGVRTADEINDERVALKAVRPGVQTVLPLATAVSVRSAASNEPMPEPMGEDAELLRP